MKRFVCLLIVPFLTCCEEVSDEPNTTYEVVSPENPQPKGNRMFGISMSESRDGFEASYAKLKEAGTDMVELNIPWNAIEISEGNYTDPYGLLAATEFYGHEGLKVCFSIAVINTVSWEIPGYLSDVSPDSQGFISAFNNMIDWFMANIPDNVSIPGLSIGNEIDLVLTSDEDWSRYTVFYREAVDHLKKNYPEVQIGVKTTVMNGIFTELKSKVMAINEYSDVVMLNYYPQNDKFEVKSPESVHVDFQRIVDEFPSQKIWMTEIGYQSGSNYCKSSETRQAHFFHNMFTAWDNHKEEIEYILVDWLHDQSNETIEEWKGYYGDQPALVEYLSTLGVRNFDGTDKAAWLQILEETKVRGW